MSEPRRMPRGEALEVEHKKAAGYLLNLAHQDGESKARFFLRCGFKVEDWESFARALREHGATREVIGEEETKFGRKYRVECQLTTPDGFNPCILSVWIQTGNRPPRLVTAHPQLG